MEGVEHERSPTAHAREDRAYRGRLYVTLDARGALAAVHGVPLEELLRGIVPSEMPASSHARGAEGPGRDRPVERARSDRDTPPDRSRSCSAPRCTARPTAARAHAPRAPTRRSARPAARRSSDGRTRPWWTRSTRRCAAATARTTTRSGGTPPSPSLRGRPDLPAGEAARWTRGLADEPRLRAFLAAAPDAYCRRPAAARRDRYRWERRFQPAELDAALASLGVGKVRAIAVRSRGVSGRARVLEVDGRGGPGGGRRRAADPAAAREPPLLHVRRRSRG